MPEPLRLAVQHGHLIYTNEYDENLNPVASSVLAASGYRLNGHRTDCRCETCRPDIARLLDPEEKTDA